MPPPPFNRRLSLATLVAMLALVANVRAQESAPSPSPSPSTSPAPVAPVQVDAAQIEAAVERTENQRRRELEEALKGAKADRKTVERGARNAARQMAELDALRSKVFAGSVQDATRSQEANARALAEAQGYGARAAAEAHAMEAAAVHEATEGHEARQAHEEAVREAMQESQAEKREKAREKEIEVRERNRELQQEAREKAQEARERQQSARERQRDEAERVEELYEEAMSMIEEEEWNGALRSLNRLVSLNSKLDAALYWSGYAQGKMNRTATALATLGRLQKEFPTSRWAKEARALEMEVRGKSGQAPRPDQEDDVDLKLMALSALAQSDPEEALPMLAKILASPTSSRRVRDRSLFVLAQMGSEQAGHAIAEVARGNHAPELQRKAIQYLGVFGGPANRKILSDVYSATTDNTIRKQILNSFMVSGDKARVLNAAKTEKDPGLRTDAIRLLGIMGGSAELSQMYPTATSTDEKKAILHALFLSGAIEPMANAAKGEKDKEARLSAVRNLGLMGRKSETFLLEMYRAETDFEIKKEVLNAFFLQGNGTRLVEIARAEKDAQLKKEAVHWLSLMNSKESRAYMMELLK